MSVPANHISALAGTQANIGRWIEIEGLPYAFGSFTNTNPANFFSTRGVAQRPLGIKPYLTKVPRGIDQNIDTLKGGSQTTGAAEFEIADIDGSVAQLLGVGYQTGFTALSAEINGSVTTIPYPNGGGAAFSNGGYCYIGTETIKIGTVGATSFTGCTRGYFNSKPQAFGLGIPIGTRPYTMANRRCWYRQVAVAGQGRQSLDVTGIDGDSCVRLSGLLDDMPSGDTPHKWRLIVHTMDEELDRQIFRDLRSFPLQSIIMSDKPYDDTSDEGPGQIQIAGYPWYNVNQFSVANDSHWAPPLTSDGLPLFGAGEYFLLRIDDEIFQCLGLASGRVQFQARALLGTKPEKHTFGASAREVVSIIENAAVLGMEIASKFTAVPPVGRADHPLAILLQLLLSTGTGDNYPGSGTNYDVLPEGWGLGVDYWRVDVSGIEAAIAEDPTIRFGGTIEEAVNYVRLSQEQLSFAGYYYYVAIGDLYRIKRLRPPEPDAQEADVRTIDDSVRIRKALPHFEPNWSGAVREVIYSYAWDMLRGKFKVADIFKLAGGELYSKGKARTLEYSSKLVYRGRSGIPGEPPFQRFDIQAWLTSRAEFFKVRYGRPPPVVHERVTYDFIDVEPGDLLFVTSDSLLSTSTGALGATDEVGEVIAVSIDDEAKNVNLTILMTGWQLGNYRYIGPSLKINAVNSVGGGTGVGSESNVVVNQNDFTETTGADGFGQTDWILQTPKGEVSPFSAGLGVTHVDGRLWKADFSAYQDVAFAWDDKGSGSLLIYKADGTVWTWDPAPDMYITHSVYANHRGVLTDDNNSIFRTEVTEIITDFSAFAAANDDKLNAGLDAGHVLFPT